MTQIHQAAAKSALIVIAAIAGMVTAGPSGKQQTPSSPTRDAS
ncbi:MAG: hypothetical protein R3B91_13920 [Planctomycetaceae bacterium]